MFRVLGCIVYQHDLRLVVLAAIMCLFACATAMMMISRGRHTAGNVQTLWLVMGGFVAGCGIWSLHFVAMLAYRTGLPVTYDVQQTAFSAIIAAVLCGAGFKLALTRVGAASGGAVAGAAICAMHYAGMAAVRIPANAHWDLTYVVGSLVIGVVLTALALHIALRRNDLRGYVIGTVLFLVAIVGLHFTAMAAVTYSYNPLIPEAEGLLAPEVLAIAVAAVAVLILGAGMGLAVVDHHLAERAAGEAARLRTYIARLEETKAELEETLRDRAVALTKADAASKSKSAFLAAMSHELRTPLNAIIGFSEMMSLEAFGPLGCTQYRNYSDNIHESGKHLLSLISDILDISRLEAGKAELHEEAVDVATLVKDCLRMVEHQAAKGGLALSDDVPPGAPRVLADERRMKQVLINLLSNAVKFTQPGGTVHVRVRSTLEGMFISVEDSGIGIAPEDIARAFERFSQIDSTVARYQQGAGLGLPLSRQLMELHGGTLMLQSVVSVGTIATAKLPASRILARSRAAA
ncbi:MAG TPA: MHYT domain-containing protein [Rhizomicrobium sp.]|jgi:signal transduction histidine kinase|nr:MHYT domain-containing protein [Rhizomicrobium sp.]